MPCHAFVAIEAEGQEMHMSDGEVIDNKAEHQYELVTEGAVAFAHYREEGGAIVFDHTVVPKELEGRGIAGRLVKAAIADVRSRGLKVVPVCSFVAAWFERHPEEQDLLATDAPG